MVRGLICMIIYYAINTTHVSKHIKRPNLSQIMLIYDVLTSFNWIDLIVVVVVLYFILTNKGFIETVCEAGGFFGSLLFSYKLYPFVSSFLSEKFFLTRGIANGLGFLLSWLLIESVVFFIISFLVARFFSNITKTNLNKILGYSA